MAVLDPIIPRVLATRIIPRIDPPLAEAYGFDGEALPSVGLITCDLDDALCGMLAGHRPLWLNTQFNHPREVTPEAMAACEKLVAAGIPDHDPHRVARAPRLAGPGNAPVGDDARVVGQSLVDSAYPRVDFVVTCCRILRPNQRAAPGPRVANHDDLLQHTSGEKLALDPFR